MKHNTVKLNFSFVSLIVILFVFALSSFAQEKSSPQQVESPRSGESIVKGIVILVEFPDVKENVSMNFIRPRFTQQLYNYVRDMSYDKVSLKIDFTKKWYTMPDSISQYKISPHNLEVDKSRIKKLIDDALNASDEEVDFSQYSFAAIFMAAKLQDYGMIGLCGFPGMLGWSAQDVLKTPKGETIKGGVAIFCYQAHVGTLFHDIAHILGGVKDGKRMVPCLYDHDLQAKAGPLREVFVDSLINMGYWDPMSCHYYKMGTPPPGISSWTKLRLGWIDPERIKVVKPEEKTEVVLGPLENASSEFLVIKIPITEKKYYLIENRQQIGQDRILPTSGVLIMYADDDMAECRNRNAPVKLMDANPSIPHLEGAAFDIGKRDTFQDDRNRIKIQLMEKIGNSYKIQVSSF